MFERLQKKWKVSGIRLFLIFCTFAIGGSLTGYLGKKLMNIFSIDERWLWIIVYIIVVTVLWPMTVLAVSIFFGQFKFFTGYLKKMATRMGFSRNNLPASPKAQPINSHPDAAGTTNQSIN